MACMFASADWAVGYAGALPWGDVRASDKRTRPRKTYPINPKWRQPSRTPLVAVRFAR